VKKSNAILAQHYILSKKRIEMVMLKVQDAWCLIRHHFSKFREPLYLAFFASEKNKDFY